MIGKSDISEIRKNIEDCVGQKVFIRGREKRNKPYEKEATILETHPNIFLVKMDDTERNESFSYTDILTKAVELDVSVDGNYNSILNMMSPEITL